MRLSTNTNFENYLKDFFESYSFLLERRNKTLLGYGFGMREKSLVEILMKYLSTTYLLFN